jgi:hypothetical protein
MSRRAPFSALLVAVLLGVTGPSARADPSDLFHASISPATVQPLSGHSYGLQISNLGSSNHSANNAHVTIPAGFTVNPASLSAATTAAGACSATTWAVSIDLSSTINAVAPSDAASELCPGAQLTISFSAAAPALESDYEWTTTLFQDGNQFSLEGQQPDVTVDGAPPPPPTITSGPPSVTASTSATFSFTDGDATAVFLCSLDDASFSSCTSPVTYDGLAEGAHTFRVKARDPAGNESPVTSYTWSIDLTSPVVTIDSGSKPPDPTNQTSASFVFTSNKAGSTFECRLDEGQFSACTSPQGYSGLSDRRHTFGVRATDPLGNQGLETIYSWTVDTAAPATSITSGPPTTTESRTATFSFSSTELPATFACSLDGSAFNACASPKTYDGLSDAAHVFAVRATDLAGNTDASPASYSWQVSTQAPRDLTPPGTVLELRRSVGWRTLRLSWALPSDADFDHVQVLRSRSAKGAAQAVVYAGDGTGYSDAHFLNGTYYRYEIRSYDHAGNASRGVRVVVRASALLFSPRDGGLVRVPPLFRWARVRNATFYNIQLYRGSRKILSAWPAKPLLKLRRTWVYDGHRYRLRKGGYRWWVWPAFGSRSKPKYGRILGTGTFRVR